MEARLTEIKDRLVKEIDAEYRATLGFPVPVIMTAVSKGIRELCKEGFIGIQHNAGNFCQVNPNLTETEIFNAKITPPFERPPIKEACPKCGKKPCVCPPVLPETCPVCGQLPCQCVPPPEIVCPKCGKKPCICSKRENISLAIAPQTSIGSLRQDNSPSPTAT